MPGVSSVPPPTCWKVSQAKDIGRILTSSRDIKSWELVIQDTALVAGPKVRPVCLGCLAEVDGSVLCEKCQWPLCGAACQQQQSHLAECDLFTAAGFYPKSGPGELARNIGLYSCVSIIRVLLLKLNNSQGWDLIQNMMDHWQERSTDDKVMAAIKVTTKLVIQRLGMSWVNPRDVEKVYGVLKTNAVDIKDGRGQALFPQSVCIMSHSCNANLEAASDPTENISFRAKRQILEGEELTIRYCDFLESKYHIRSQILSEWKFLCLCQRCTDDTEFRTHFSSLKCPCGGYFYHHNITTDHSSEIDEDNRWECSSCGRLENLSSQYKKADKILKELEDKPIDLVKMRKLQNVEYFHENFYLLIKLRISFIEQNKNTNDRYGEFHTIKCSALRVASCCRETLEELLTEIDIVLRILNQLDRGCTRLSGFYLQIKTNCQHKILKMKHEERQITDQELKKAILQLTKMKMFAAKLRSSFTEVNHS